MVNELEWRSLEEYANNIFSINYVQWKSRDWIKSKCSCEYWAKNYFCHHVIGLAVFKKNEKFLDIHMEIPIGQTRARGQPKKTASALNKQCDNLPISSDSSSVDTSSADTDPSPVKKVVKKITKKKASQASLTTTLPKKRGPKPKNNSQK